ncbi:MAG: hypothetical protein M1114_06240 [Candidatus Dependentiae bacterium]|nr:hypothetical protein [Candidatus Dependentiae bacterium]
MNVKRTISLLLLSQYLLCGNSMAMESVSNGYAALHESANFDESSDSNATTGLLALGYPEVSSEIRYNTFLIGDLKKIGAWPNPEPAKDAVLDEKVVTSCSPFWRKIKQNVAENGALSKQDEKEIKKVCKDWNNDDYTRHVQRFNLAAALYLGINTEFQWMRDVLSHFVFYNDCPLVALMLEKGCNPNTVNSGEPIIFHVKTVAMAELLRSHGADFNVTAYGWTLLHDIFIHAKDHALIPYYIKYGVNPLQQDGWGKTALQAGITYHGLCDDKRQNIINRVARFMEAGVSEDAILAAGQEHYQKYLPDVKHAIGLYYKNR